MNLIDSIEAERLKKNVPALHPGDTVDVHYLIREGEKERVQVFTGTVIAIQGRGIRRNFVVRRIVQGQGVERTFPLHSPRVQDVRIVRRGNVRRAKLYYLRDRFGKRTRVRELVGDKVRRERERTLREAAEAASEVRSAAEASEASGETTPAEEAVQA